MSLSERRVLHSVRIIGGQFAEFEWNDQILRDGEVIQESKHNGAYPINEDGSFDSNAESLKGMTIGDFIGEAADNAIRESHKMRLELDSLKILLKQLQNENN